MIYFHSGGDYIKRIGVVAETKVDTEIGVELLKKYGFNVSGTTIGKDPQGNTRLQVLERNKLEKLVLDNIYKMKKHKKIDIVLIYCNSLSTSINLNKIKEEAGLPIVTPLKSYIKAGKKHDIISVLGANNQALAGIEKIIQSANKNAQIVGVSALPIVYRIEKGQPPYKIIEQLDLANLIKFIEKVGSEIIILGCTHFPYLKNELEKITRLEIFNPDNDIIKRLESIEID